MFFIGTDFVIAVLYLFFAALRIEVKTILASFCCFFISLYIVVHVGSVSVRVCERVESILVISFCSYVTE